MSKRNPARRAVVIAIALVACLALPASAFAAEVTVRVEGEAETLFGPTTVTIGNGSGPAEPANEIPLPNECANDTAYQAVELATGGEWDRALYAEEIGGEEHTWASGEEYWVPYYNNNYGDWGICQQHLEDGDTVLMQAAVTGTEENGFIPDSVPLELEVTSPASGPVELGKGMTVHVTAWQPLTIFGEEDPEFPGEHWIIPPSEAKPAVGYTVKAGAASAVTNGSGNVTLTMNAPGPVMVQASMPGSLTNWGRTVPVEVCVDDGKPATCP